MSRLKHSALALLALTAALNSPVGAAPVTEQAKDKPAASALKDPNAEDEAAPAVTVTVDPALAKAGGERYHSYCFKCHGQDMVTQGGGSFDLRTFPLDGKARFMDSVANGKRTMPAWGAVLGPKDIEALWNYVARYQVEKR